MYSKDQLAIDRARDRDAVLAAASRVLHDHDGTNGRAGIGCLRARVSQALDMPAASIDVEFEDDQALLAATIGWLSRIHLRRQQVLADLLTAGDFQRWTHAALVQSRTPGSVFGCELGWLAGQAFVAGQSRTLLDNTYCAWQWQLATALHGLERRGVISPGTDVQRLGATLLSLLQGAYMTACRTRDLGVIAATFDAAARTVINPPNW